MTAINYDGPAFGLLLAFAVGWISLVVAGISAIASAWKGHKDAEAAKEAANIQVQGTKDAQGYIDRGYADAKAALQPYVSAGQMALGSLMSTGGYSMPASSAAPITPTAPTNPLGPVYNAPPSRFPERALGVMARNGVGPTQDEGDWNASRRPDQRALRLSEVMSGAQAQTQSSYVKMQAPDGSVESVPSQYVNHYTNLGATVVG